MSPADFHANVDSAILSTYHISSLEDILEICAFKKHLANQTGKYHYTKINLIDSARASQQTSWDGINKKYISLLKAAGIRSVDDLARFTPEKLLAILLDINLEKKITQKLPSLSQIYDWVRQAVVFHEVLAY
ncbi:MAG: DUF4332 domain-containing protein [Clostridiales bacterium]|nr:DUF4332 domain-containing protein [Clostridiales bacterium]